MVRARDKRVGSFPVKTGTVGAPVLQTIDKLVMTQPGELHIIYSHKSSVSIWGENPVLLFEYLQTQTPLRYTEFARATVTEFEETQAA